MVLDHRQQYLGNLHQALSLVVTPVQYVVNWPTAVFSRLKLNLSTRQALLEENTHLHAEQLLLQTQIHKMQLLEQENQQLRNLLKSPLRNNKWQKMLVADTLAIDADLFTQELIIDKSQPDQLYIGQPVVNAKGIMGQVIQIGPLSSRVLLLSDVRSAIPVQNSRTGIRGIVAGTGRLDKLSLINMPITSDIQVGDLLFSSGLGGRFPAGYPVGTISQVQHKPGEQFAVITVKPSANLNGNEQALLIWPKTQEENRR